MEHKLKIGFYYLGSGLHNEDQINFSLQPFLDSIEESLGEKIFKVSPKDIKKEPILPIIFIQSGGVEEKFKRIYQQFSPPYFLLAPCWHNALPAALEIKEYLRKRNEQVEILHGSAHWIAERISFLKKIVEAKKSCRRFRAGVLGKPSNWLIASGADYNIIRKRLGIKIFDLPIEEMIRHIDQVKESEIPEDKRIKSFGKLEPETVRQSLRIYQGLKNLAQEYQFNALTVRCFDLLDFYQNTSCLALSLLNQEGIISGCEGDIPALVSMIIASQLSHQSVFMANPASVDHQKNHIVFAHCTIPLDMCGSFDYRSHFETGKGIAVHGQVEKGPVTIFKVDGNLDRRYIVEGELLESLDLPELCRSQLQVEIEEPVADFLEKSIANHHIIIQGKHKKTIEKFFTFI